MTPLDADERSLLVALAHIDGFGPARLRTAVTVGVQAAWEHVRSGREPDGAPRAAAMAGGWPAAIARLDPVGLWRRHVEAGVQVTCSGDPGHPDLPVDVADAPALLFWRGPGSPRPDRPRPWRPAVALVGTRRSTRYGLGVAGELGRQLAGVGVQVVSGLALGIDAAAHAGALAAVDGAPPVAVVAGGLDVVYPARNRELWRAVERTGTVVSEAPLGQRPERWRFPARNRIVVGLSQVVVVVESHERGGSLLTAGFAGDVGVPVMAVPGPVTSEASRGANGLIADGCAPCLGVADIVSLLGFAAPGPPTLHSSEMVERTGAASADRADPSAPGPASPVQRSILDALAVDGTSVGELVEMVGETLAEVGLALAALEDAGLVVAEHGRYARSVGRSPSARDRAERA